MHQELAICIYYNYLDRHSLEVGCRRPRFFSQFSRQGGRTESVSYLVEDLICTPFRWSRVYFKLARRKVMFDTVLWCLWIRLGVNFVSKFSWPSFGKSYMDTPFWFRILQFKTMYWTVLLNNLACNTCMCKFQN